MIEIPDAADRPIVFHVVPLTMSYRDALRYTGLAPKMFRMLERGGSFHPKRYGRNGGLAYLTAELERVVDTLFSGAGVPSDADSFFASDIDAMFA